MQVRKTDGTIAYADAADAIPAAIQLGYNIFRDVDRLETVIDIREVSSSERHLGLSLSPPSPAHTRTHPDFSMSPNSLSPMTMASCANGCSQR